MLEVSRATKPEELKKVINLVNKVFMARHNYLRIMGKQFPHLFNFFAKLSFSLYFNRFCS